MATAVGLNFQLTASAVGMTKGLDDASKQLGRLGAAAQKAASDVSVLKTLSIGRAFIDGIQSVYSSFSGFAQGAFQAVESTSNLSRELGISYAQLQQLQLAAQLAGVSTESLGRAFTKAQVAITEASQGGKEAVKALAAIGLSAADFKGLSSSEQFTLIAQAIANIADPAQRAAAAVSIFGRSGAELLPAFRELAQNLRVSQELLAKFGGGLTQLQQGRVNDVGDKFLLVSKSIELVRDRLIAALAPALTQVANNFVDFLASLNIAAVASTATKVIDGLGGAMTVAYAVAELLGPAFGVINDAIKFLAENARGAAIGFTSAVGALAAYEIFCGLAEIATIGFSKAIRAMLSSSGIGLIAVVVGVAGGALLEWALKADEAGGRAKSAADESAKAADKAAASAIKVAAATAGAIKDAFAGTEDAAKKAADEAKKASDAARREADQAIERMNVEMNFGGDAQRANAAKAVQAIQTDILRTEQEIAAAREAGDKAAETAGTQRLQQLDQALAREQEIASGARKAAEQRAKIEAKIAEQRLAFEENIANAFRRPTDTLKLEDTRTVSGYEALQRFSQDQQNDPALEEYRKQLKELQAIRRELANVDAVGTVDIAG